jgi:uncharacterized protein
MRRSTRTASRTPSAVPPPPTSVYRTLSRLQVKGFRPVDADHHGALLRRAVAAHVANADVNAYARAVTSPDDPFGPTGIILDDFGTVAHVERIQASGAAVFSWGSWLDGSSADGVLRRFCTYTNPSGR